MTTISRVRKKYTRTLAHEHIAVSFTYNVN